MNTTTPAPASDALDVLSLAELADRLHVNSQTIDDLRKKGRGPRGFLVGRRLMFRLSEVESWLSTRDPQGRCRRCWRGCPG